MTRAVSFIALRHNKNSPAHHRQTRLPLIDAKAKSTFAPESAAMANVLRLLTRAAAGRVARVRALADAVVHAVAGCESVGGEADHRSARILRRSFACIL